MLLDKTLSWKHHIIELRKKLSRAVGILYRMKKHNSPQNILISLYHSLFHSHLSYGICLYGLANDQYTDKIYLIQKRAIRLISNASHNAHTEPLFRQLKILNFQKVLNFQLSILMWEYDHNDLPTIFDTYFEKAKNVHSYNTRFSASDKLAENILVNTDLHGKKLLKFLGPRIFNKIIDLDFYHTCKNKIHFKNKLKNYLIFE